MEEKLDNRLVKDFIGVIVSDFKENEAKINTLNVFPVPDGDTGTNMLLTLKSIQQEVLSIKNCSIKTIADRVSYGALMGARGNSGVILSQILKGFLDVIIRENNFDIKTLKSAAKSSMELAYSSVQNPTEGTMLTTIKDIYQTLSSLNGQEYSRIDLLDMLINETEKSVLRTTFLLPVLKQAGVVDAGAQGIFEILNGIKKALINLNQIDKSVNKVKNSKVKKMKEDKELVVNDKSIEGGIPDADKEENVGSDAPGGEEIAEGSSVSKRLNLISRIKNIYCTEMMIKGAAINIIRLREDIESLGDSAMIVGNDSNVKIHVHTNYPQKVLKRALKEGTLHDIQINNMVDQSKQAISTEVIEDVLVPKKEFGIIAIANGDGFEEIFKSIGADIVLKGGQSMNPSTYEIVKAINKLDSDKIIVLPNNKNIILAANQAKKIIKRNISVIPTKSIPQGISAALLLNQDLSIEENVDNMTKAMESLKTGEVTVAVRDANLYFGEIKKGAFIGLGNGMVKVIAENQVNAVIELVREMISENEEILTIYFGDGATPEDNKLIHAKLKSYYPGLEIEFHKGGQPLYPYIFSIE
jgi:DAK2 domain fusion protein YloV